MIPLILLMVFSNFLPKKLWWCRSGFSREKVCSNYIPGLFYRY